MKGRSLTLLLLLASVSAFAEQLVAEELSLPSGPRQAMEAELQKAAPVSAYLASIESPTRRVSAEVLELTLSDIDGNGLIVVGPLTDTELKQVLLAEKLEEPVSRVVGDDRYARLYFGDPKKNSCCYGEWTYSKESGEWKRIFEYSRSH